MADKILNVFNKNSNIYKGLLALLVSLTILMVLSISIFILIMIIYILNALIPVGTVLTGYLLGIISAIIILAIVLHQKLTNEELKKLVEKFGVFL